MEISMDRIRIHVIPTANDDGSQAAVISPDQIQAAIPILNAIYNTADIEFTFNPDDDFEPHRHSTLLNHDATLLATANLNNPPNIEPDCDYDSHTAERNRVAREFRGKLVIFFSSGDRPIYNNAIGQWQFIPRTNNWSNHFDEFVTMHAHTHDNPILGYGLSHEIGHYLHLPHTHVDGKRPLTVDDAKQCIKDYVDNLGHDKNDGDKVFDGDHGWSINDTPPDPGPAVFDNNGMDPYSVDQPVMSIDVPLNSGITTYTLAPQRQNIMGYWDRKNPNLPFPIITTDQAAGVRSALEDKNRQHLITPISVHKPKLTGTQFAASTWAIMIGILMLTPNGITCIACGDTVTNLLGLGSIALGTTSIGLGFLAQR